MAEDEQKREILIEYVVQGHVVKTTAIDAATGTEVSIMGPASAPREALAEVAVRKLNYMMKKNG